MKLQFSFLRMMLAFIVLALATVALGQRQSDQPDLAMPSLGKGFVSKTVNVTGTTLHYARGGTGPAVILVHGFPEDWSGFRKIMPRLAAKYIVIAIDLRGVGSSTPTPDGYGAANLATDIYQLAQQLKLERPYVVGRDIGGMVTYAFVRLHPEATRGVMILDVPLPGIEPWEEVKRDPELWHFGFHQTPKVPEELIAGRQFLYFRDTFFERLACDKSAIAATDIAHYAKSYGTPKQLRAGLELYRAFPADEKFNDARHDVIDVPIALVGGDHAVGELEPKIAEPLRMHGCANVSIEVVKNSGHFVAEEQPAVLVKLIERYAR